MARPSKLTPQVEAKLVEVIGAGLDVGAAAAFLKLSRRTVERWLERGRGGKSRPCRRFALAVEQARAQCELREVLHVRKAAQNGNVKASMWLLEHVRPERWGRRRPIEEELVAPDETAARIREALRQMEASVEDPPATEPTRESTKGDSHA